MTEHKARVGQRRLCPARAIADRPRHRPRAVRSDMQDPARIDPRDGPAPGPHAFYVDGRKPRHVAAERLSDPGFARHRDAAATHKADIEGRPPGIRNDGIGHRTVARGIEPARHRCHRRPRVQRVDRRARKIARHHRAPLRGQDKGATPEPFGGKAVGQAAKIAGHQRAQRCVDGRAGGPAVFAQRGVQLVRQRDRHARQSRGQNLAKPQFMCRVADRPEQADRHRLDTVRLQPVAEVGHGVLVQRVDDAPVRGNPLRHLECQVARHIGRGVRHAKIERLASPALAKGQDFRMPPRCQKSGSCRPARDDGVDGMCRSMNEQRRPAEKVAQRQVHVLRGKRQRVQHAPDRIGRRRRRLVQPYVARSRIDHEIGKGAARVASQPHDATSLSRGPCPCRLPRPSAPSVSRAPAHRPGGEHPHPAAVDAVPTWPFKTFSSDGPTG